MTRQRMRGSHGSVHFTDCPTCHGRPGPAPVLRRRRRAAGSAVLEHDKVARVEMVVSPRRGNPLSQRRKALGRIERSSGKGVEVRVSETHAVDRITLYAYDGSGTDIGLDRLNGKRARPDVVEWDMGPETEDWSSSLADEQPVTHDEAIDEPALPATDEMGLLAAPGIDDHDEQPAEGGGKKKRRRRRGRGHSRADEAQAATPAAARTMVRRPDARPSPDRPDDASAAQQGDEQQGERKRRRRRRRRGGRAGAGQGAAADGASGHPSDDESAPEHPSDLDGDDSAGHAPPDARTDAEADTGDRGRDQAQDQGEAADPDHAPSDSPGGEQGADGGDGQPRRRRRRRGGRGRRGGGEERAAGRRRPARRRSNAASVTEPRPMPRPVVAAKPAPAPAPAPPPPGVPAGAKPKSLYGGARRKLAPSEKGKIKASKD